MLAQRYGVQVTGFDTPGLAEKPVREFAAAIDRVLTDYPMIGLDLVAVADLAADAAPVQWRWESRESAVVRSITLDRGTAGASATSDSVNEPSDSPVYSATVRALGQALDSAGGGAARAQARHALVSAYMQDVAGRYTTLAQLMRGYRQWRSGLPGATDETGRFDTPRALAAGFAEVVLRGSAASVPARTLHALLVDTAPQGEQETR